MSTEKHETGDGGVRCSAWLGGNLVLQFKKWPDEKPPYGKPCLVRGRSYDAHYQHDYDIAALTYCGDDAPATWCRGKQQAEMYEVWEWAPLPPNAGGERRPVNGATTTP